MLTVSLSSKEIIQLQAGKKTSILIPSSNIWPNQLTPGALIGIKESWAPAPVQPGGSKLALLFKADQAICLKEPPTSAILEKWLQVAARAPAAWWASKSLPSWACRYRIAVAAAKKVQVHNLTAKELKELGLEVPSVDTELERLRMHGACEPNQWMFLVTIASTVP